MTYPVQPGNSQRGAVLVMFMLAAVVVFAVTGMAVDLGVAYMQRSTLAKAVDAAALAGARATSRGDLAIEDLARKVADANYHIMGVASQAATYDIAITRPGTDVVRVSVSGTASSKTSFSRILGHDSLAVATTAEATRYPLDMSLVLDLSYSLERNGAFSDMQSAATSFLSEFDQNLDQMGIVTYSTWAEEQMPLQKSFATNGANIISGLSTISDTNIEEGLRVAKRQLDIAGTRSEALKVVVLFTDGRPTAFAGNLWYDGLSDTCSDEDPYACDPDAPGECLSGGSSASRYGSARGFSRISTNRNRSLAPGGDGKPGNDGDGGRGNGQDGNGDTGEPGEDADGDGTPECYQGVAAAYVSGNSYRGTFVQTSGAKVVGFSDDASAELAANGSTNLSPRPKKLPDGSPVHGGNIRALAAVQAEAWANAIREADYSIYVIALGNPDAHNEYDQPDLELLRRLANQNGAVNRSQPQGQMIFAPTPEDLETAFSRLADRLKTRLTR